MKKMILKLALASALVATVPFLHFIFSPVAKADSYCTNFDTNGNCTEWVDNGQNTPVQPGH